MKTVLITGCSSGIGLDAARHMRDRGWRVIATCRKDEDIQARRAEGFVTLHLELSDPKSVVRCAREALAMGPVDALVNNAAFAIPGAVEDLPRGALRAIFENLMLDIMYKVPSMKNADSVTITRKTVTDKEPAQIRQAS